MDNIVQMMMGAAGAAGAAGATDPNFNQTTLLLHGDGTNGAQNNTFLDSSSNNFTITRNGNTTQGTFSPFSLPNGEWSNYFDGSGDYLSIADNAAFTLGSGDFTIECWLYSTNSGVRQFISGQLDSGGADATTSFVFLKNVNNKLEGVIRSSTTGYTVSSSANIPLNAWTHVAFVRDGNTNRLYINGIQDGTVNVTGVTVIDSSNQVAIGRAGEYNGDYYFGYISNFRLVKGTCLYTGGTTFTPPTAPLTNITNTSLLTCQSNRFVDNSSNAFAITVNGNTSVQPFSPFAPSAAYSPSVNGGSGYFDGNGDYLTLTDNGDLDFGTGNFTIETWIYPTTGLTTSNLTIIDTRPTTSANGNYLFFVTTAAKLQFSTQNDSGSSGNFTSTATLSPFQWTHVAVARQTNTLRIFINGALDSSHNCTGLNFNASLFSIGNGTYSGTSLTFWNGYFSSMRCVKGTAVYTAAFTPPTAPLTAITNTELLCNFTNAGIFDNTGKNNLETVGNAQIDTTTKKFGTGSMEFDGTGDYLSAEASPTVTQNMTFGTGNFTIEMWVYLNQTPGAGGFRILYDTRPNLTHGPYPMIYFDGANATVKYFVNNADRITGGNLSTSTWYHLAICRSGTSTKLFIDGTQSGSTYTDSTDYLAYRLYIGASSFASGFYAINGYIDDLRITKGIARYTANFTPPTEAFPNL